MSLIGSESILVQAMKNYQVGFQTIANNLANAQTVGYSREIAQFTENAPLSYGSYVVGMGASVSTIERVRNGFLDAQVRQYSSQQSYSETLGTALNQLASVFPDINSSTSTEGISTQLTAFYNALSELASNASPAIDSADKATVISDAVTLAATFRTTSANLSSVLSNLNDQVQAAMTDANTQMQLIAKFNGQIKEMESAGGTPNTLLDQREQAMEALAKDISVNFAEASDGTIIAYSNVGTLVQETEAGTFSPVDGVPHPDLAKIGFAGTGGIASDVTAQITGGKMAALISAENTTLTTIENVQSMATGVISNVNTVYSTAKDTSGNSSNFFTGTNAASILVNSALINDSTGLLTAFRTSDSDQGDLAAALASTASDYYSSYVQSVRNTTINADAPLSAFAGTPLVPASSASGAITITLGSSSTVTVNWTNADSLQTIAERINTALAGAGVAVYNGNTGEFTILTSQAVSLYDTSGNLTQVLNLASFLTSATNINATADPNINSLSATSTLTSYNGKLDTFITAADSGVISVNGVKLAWTGGEDMNTIAADITSSTGVNAVYDATKQELILSSRNWASSAINPITSFTASDVSGNLAAATLLYTPTSVSNAYAGLQSSLGGAIATASTAETEATTSLTQVQDMIANDSTVDITTELALASEYQRAYQASARVLAIIDDVMDVLINGTSTNASAFSK
jgi:flagellar hook-associated protein 1 FlgK